MDFWEWFWQDDWWSSKADRTGDARFRRAADKAFQVCKCEQKSGRFDEEEEWIFYNILIRKGHSGFTINVIWKGWQMCWFLILQWNCAPEGSPVCWDQRHLAGLPFASRNAQSSGVGNSLYWHWNFPNTLRCANLLDIYHMKTFTYVMQWTETHQHYVTLCDIVWHCVKIAWCCIIRSIPHFTCEGSCIKVCLRGTCWFLLRVPSLRSLFPGIFDKLVI